MKIITGSYEKVKQECSKYVDNTCFEFYFSYVSDSVERFREIDRFLYESRKRTRFKNKYIGDIVIDVSDWNNEEKLNNYFDLFMYFVKDNMEHNRFILTADKQCSKALLLRLKRFFKLEEVCLEPAKLDSKIKMGFALPDDKEESSNVRA